MPQKIDKTNQLICAIDNLSDVIQNLDFTHAKDYSGLLLDIVLSLREIGGGPNSISCLNRIHHELHLLNKSLMMSALLITAIKEPEKTLHEYHKIIDEYLK